MNKKEYYDLDSLFLNKKEKTQTEISNLSWSVLIWMFIYNTGYLWSETLQSSSLISNSSHYKNTIITSVYDLLLINILCYGLFKYSNILIPNKYLNFKWMMIYLLSVVFGCIGFALLGEVPFLKNLSITKDFWKHLNTKAKITIIFFTIVMIYISLKEIYDSIKINKFKKELIKILGFGGLYCLIYTILKMYDAKDVIYHVHHAIFASILSLLFLNWESRIELIIHGILVGIMIEGINFYGIGELQLFLFKTTSKVIFIRALSISILFSLLFIWGVFYLNMMRNKVRIF